MSGSGNSGGELVVVVVNYRTPGLTLRCMESLAEERREWGRFRVVLVDNASGDGSAEELGGAIRGRGWGEWIDFRLLGRNLGFAGGNNLVLEEELGKPSPAPFLLLLNSDTVVHRGCLRASVESLRRQGGAGAMSCLVLNEDGSVQNVCRRFPTPVREVVRAFGLPWVLPRVFGWGDLEDGGWDRRVVARDVDWISGAFFLARAEALRQVGLMDTEFFFYGEDCEWCWRFWRRGWRVWYDPAGQITHLGGGSSDSSRLLDRQRQRYRWGAWLLVQRKCFGAWAEGVVWGSYVLAAWLQLRREELAGRRGSQKAEEYRVRLEVLRELKPRRRAA